MCALLIVMVAISLASASTYSEGRNLNKFLLANYSKEILPRLIHTNIMEVNVDFALGSIIDFDGVTGIIFFTGGFVISWKDEQIAETWKQSEFTHLDKTQLSVHDVWIPKIYIKNMADQISIFPFSSYFDSETTYATFDQNGTALIMLITNLKTSCSIDMTYYPFDKHTCEIYLIYSHMYYKLAFNTSRMSANFEHTIPNSEWSFSSSVYRTEFHALPTIVYVLNLSRKPLFLVMNLLFPCMVIGIVNSLSFLIPIESGERLSFGVSLLLTFIVFVTTVLDNLPSTDTFSFFNVLLLVQLIYSSLIVFGIVQSIHYYYQDCKKPVPGKIKRMTKCIMSCNRNNKKSNRVKPGTENSKIDNGFHEENSMKEQGYTGKDVNDKLKARDNNFIEGGNDENRNRSLCEEAITWKDVSRAWDRICNIIACIFSLTMLTMFSSLIFPRLD
ncbi:unnamed protein product [Mytilus coruscus]|uniref:CHRNN n=1 Tax=Mytilus coruscus TaxID=42192 RepID=A0A6J8CMR3_MYTCO|nr:unnamed protein product [Mytilus coruscus]